MSANYQRFEAVCHLAFGLPIMTDQMRHYINFDALLGAVVCNREGRPQLQRSMPIEPISIPILMVGDLPAVSALLPTSEVKEESCFLRRRSIAQQAVFLMTPGKSGKAKNIDTAAGPAKSFNVQKGVWKPERGKLRAFGIGDVEAIRDLLLEVNFVGARRAVGKGHVLRWEVNALPESTESPFLDDLGFPRRPLPIDFEGVNPDACRGYGRYLMPYHRHEDHQEIWVPR